MAAITAGIGAAAMGIGGAMSASAQSKAAKKAAKMAKFNPFNISGPGGNVSFNGDNINTQFGANQQSFVDIFQQQAQQLAAGGSNAGFNQFANNVGNFQIPGLFQGAQQASMMTPDQAFSDFGNFSQQNAMFGQQGGMAAMAAANQFGQAQTGMNEGVAQGLMGQGFGALANGNFDQQANEQIARQRAFARPGEERAVNSKFQNLFNRGALSSTGGERQLGELALSQEMADIGRVDAGTQFGNMLAQQNRQFGMAAIQGGLGARQQDSQFNLGRAQLFANQGMNLMNFGGQQAQAGLNSQIGFSDMINARAQQRLGNANQQFGFGQQGQQQNINQLMQMFGGQMGLDQGLRDQTAMAVNASSARSGANANAASHMAQSGASPLGSFLGGIGTGMVSGFGPKPA